MTPRDEDFAASLRRTTAEVPPSCLDLDAVLRSARGKTRRSRAVTGLAAVAATALVGAGAWQAAPLLDDGGLDALAASVVTGTACEDPGAVTVDVESLGSAPGVAEVTRLVVDDDGRISVENVVPVDDGPRLQAESAPPPFRQAILDAARDPHGPLTALGGAAMETEAAPTGSFATEEPGTYVAWTGAVRYQANGQATCGDRREPFVLRYEDRSGGGILECGTPEPAPDDLTAHVAIAWCPQGTLTVAQLERRRVWEEQLGGPEGLQRLEADLGLVRR